MIFQSCMNSLPLKVSLWSWTLSVGSPISMSRWSLYNHAKHPSYINASATYQHIQCRKTYGANRGKPCIANSTQTDRMVARVRRTKGETARSSTFLVNKKSVLGQFLKCTSEGQYYATSTTLQPDHKSYLNYNLNLCLGVDNPLSLNIGILLSFIFTWLTEKVSINMCLPWSSDYFQLRT